MYIDCIYSDYKKGGWYSPILILYAVSVKLKRKLAIAHVVFAGLL